MDDEILPEEALGETMTTGELHVTDLQPSPSGRRRFTFLKGARSKIFVAAAATLAIVVVAATQWGSGKLTLFALRTPTAAPTQTMIGNAPVTITGTSHWPRLSLPVPGDVVEQIEASPDKPNQIYVCAGTGYSQDEITGSPTLWRTSDAGAHWKSLLALPDGHAYCDLQFDADNADHIAVFVADSSSATQTPCTGSIWISEDGGVTWQSHRISPLHTSSAFSVWSCEFDVTTHQLYMTVNYTNNAETIQQDRTYSVTLRSDDNGATWRDITPVREDGFTDFWPLVISGDRLIGSAYSYKMNASVRTLWESHDEGIRWQIVLESSAFYLDSILTIPSTSTSMYGTTGWNPPAFLFVEHALYTTDESHWVNLPNLPVSNTNSEHAGIFTHLGVTAQGNLLVVGIGEGNSLPLNSNGNIDSQQVPLYIWEWDRAHQRWDYLPVVIPLAEPLGCGGCFQKSLSHGTSPDGAGMGTYLLLGDWDSASFWRIFIPDLS